MNRNEAGFTLIELLVVVIIGTLILIGIFQLFRTGLSVWQRIGDADEAQYQAELVLDEITGQIATAYTGNKLRDFIGVDSQDTDTGLDFDAVEFVTADSRFSGPGGYDLVRIGYCLDVEQKGLQKRVDRQPFAFTVDQNTQPDPGDLLPMRGEVESVQPEIVSLNIRYFDGVDWLDSWDARADGILPRAVEVTIGINDRNQSGQVKTFSKTVSLLNNLD